MIISYLIQENLIRELYFLSARYLAGGEGGELPLKDLWNRPYKLVRWN